MPTIDPAQTVNLLIEKVLPKMVDRIAVLEKALAEVSAKADAAQDNVLALQDYLNQQLNEMQAKKPRSRRKKTSDAPVSDAPVSDAPVSDAPVSDAPVVIPADKQAAILDLVRACRSMGLTTAEAVADVYNLPLEDVIVAMSMLEQEK